MNEINEARPQIRYPLVLGRTAPPIHLVIIFSQWRRQNTMRSNEPTSNASSISVVAISDTRSKQGFLKIITSPSADLFLRVGNLTEYRSIQEFEAAIQWINTLLYQYKVVVAIIMILNRIRTVKCSQSPALLSA